MTTIIQTDKELYKKHSVFLNKNFMLFLLLSLCLNIYGQKNNTENIKDHFNNYSELHFQEKIYLHTDKSLYITGEILWSKAYITDAHLHHSSDISKIAYIEIIDENQHAVWHTTIGIENGKGEASLIIPSSFSTGNYILRCYTNWMKNMDAAYFFEKIITILNPLKKPLSISVEKPTKINVAFFPEGGHLVTGLQSRMAIKATNEKGQGIQIKGALMITGSDTILRFETNEKGLAKCLFTPLDGKSYEAWIQEPGSEWQLSPLPEIAKQGYTMFLDDSDPEFITITVNANLSTVQSTCYLFVHCRQTLIQAIAATSNYGKTLFKLPKSRMGEGISHFTIFNEARQPIMERLYFKIPEKLLNITVVKNKEVFKPRERVTMDITSKIPGGIFSEATLSASVIKLDSNQLIDVPNIVHYFYLQSDLPARIESSPSYFRKGSGEMADLLMLTYGWRRFNWNEILNNATPSFTFLPEYSGQIISGKLVDKSRQAVSSGKTAYASIPANRYQLGISRSNEAGIVQFPFIQNQGTAELVLQPDLKNDSLLQVDWYSSFSKKFSGNSVPSFSVGGKSEIDILEMINNAQLHQVYAGGKMNSFLPMDISDTTAFLGLPDKNYFLDNYKRFSSMEEIFREFVPEVEIRKNKSNYRILVNNLPYKAFFKDEPLMLYDGVPITDVNKVMNLDPLGIKNIGIVSRRYYVAGLTYPGIIIFQTYNGDMSGYSLDPQVLLVDYEGIQVKREFYSPQYPTEKEIQKRLPDLRRLLYWAPDVNTGVAGKTSRTFYTADLPGKYAIIVEGMNDKGFVGSSLTYFEVK
jgi:hypothetical protein